MIVSLDSSLGIEFGEGYVCLVHLKKLLKQVVVAGHASIALPPDMHGQEANIFWAQEISRFIKEQKIGKENIWVSVPQRDFALRIVTLPSSAEENLREVVRYEIEKYFPFREDDIAFDYLILDRDPDTKAMRLLFMVMRKKTLESYLSILQGVGVTPLGIEMHSSALLNFFSLGDQESNGKPTALVRCNKQGFELTWISKRALRYSRAVSFHEATEAERMREILSEIHSSFRSAFPGQSIDDGSGGECSPVVYLTGEEGEDGLIKQLVGTDAARFQNLPVEAISSRLNVSHSLTPAPVSGLGLALKGIQKVPWDINILPLHLRQKSRKAGMYLSIYLVFLVLVLTITWGVSTFVRERLELRKVEREIAALQGEVSAVQKLQKEAETICEKVQGLENIQQSELSKLESLQELSKILPPAVWLTNFRYYKKDVDLAGYAASASDLISILDGSPLFYASEFTAPITRDREGIEAFKIKTKMETK